LENVIGHLVSHEGGFQYKCPGINRSPFFYLTSGRLRAFSKNPLLKGELLNLSRQKKPVRDNDMAANRAL
jgi:hypothetical protein